MKKFKNSVLAVIGFFTNLTLALQSPFSKKQKSEAVETISPSLGYDDTDPRYYENDASY